MATVRCKMCGGAIEVIPESKTVECEYCGSLQTLPKFTDDRTSNLYDRANHFRMNSEYDKAQKLFEEILEYDSHDAEVYWSLVLCKYGIVYVEDPQNHKRIPTINRMQYESVLSDSNYKKALEYADSDQKNIFEEQAEEISAIQKGILEISEKEKPFDIFICYKENDENGKRTRDSVLAQDLYTELTKEGFKVFFSRITLESKLGSAYEPYIFAALNSAKTMVVVGTKAEYFNATWVRNEWSRFLALMKTDSSKTLIPAYRDMDPYDLPSELSFLQAQDMSKLGFIQDLVRGIKKISAEPDSAKHKQKNPLLVRTKMFLEEGNWGKALEYAERILDENPEEADAYFYKFLAECRVSSIDKISSMDSFSNVNFSYALRFGDEKLKLSLLEAKERVRTTESPQPSDAQTEDSYISRLKNTSALSNTADMQTVRRPVMSERIDDNRSAFRFLFFNIITLGIYSIVFHARLGKDVNTVSKDSKKLMNFWLIVLLFSWLTLGISPIVWFHRLCSKIKNELESRGIGYSFGAGDFWAALIITGILSLIPMGVFLSFVAGFAPSFIFTTRLCKAMNLVAKNYNCKGY